MGEEGPGKESGKDGSARGRSPNKDAGKKKRIRRGKRNRKGKQKATSPL